MEHKGTVKMFRGGWGFITPDDGSRDLFVHITECGGQPLAIGDRVQFKVGASPKTDKLNAMSVELLDDEVETVGGGNGMSFVQGT